MKRDSQENPIANIAAVGANNAPAAANRSYAMVCGGASCAESMMIGKMDDGNIRGKVTEFGDCPSGTSRQQYSTSSAASTASMSSSSSASSTCSKSDSSQEQLRKHSPKRLKFSMTIETSAQATEPEFAKLDHSNPTHANRMQSRQRQILKGKNTIGYEEYRQRVPKEQRLSRSMKTPSTPDHTLEIPNKRWAGMVRAWRRALHDYDPEDVDMEQVAPNPHTVL